MHHKRFSWDKKSKEERLKRKDGCENGRSRKEIREDKMCWEWKEGARERDEGWECGGRRIKIEWEVRKKRKHVERGGKLGTRTETDEGEKTWWFDSGENRQQKIETDGKEEEKEQRGQTWHDVQIQRSIQVIK